MKETVVKIFNDYLSLYPLEKDKLELFSSFLVNHQDEELTDWNNFDGHIVASGFIYSKQDKKFLLLFHKDFNMFVYPGGHVDSDDESILEAAKREIKEESGLDELTYLPVSDNLLVPFDIAIHKVGYNERLNLPEHYHFDFRYIFSLDNLSDVHVDGDEMSDYKWVDLDYFRTNHHYGNVADKLAKYL